MSRLKHIKRIAAAGIALIIITGLVFGGHAYAKGNRFNMTYIYFGDTQAFIRNVDKAGDDLDTVSPSYFDLDDAGNLILNGITDKGFVEAMEERDVRVVPFLSNHWDRSKGRAALANRKALARQVADAVMEYGFDGVNVDIENVTGADREAYVDCEACKENCQAQRKYRLQWRQIKGLTGWQGSYDYEALARYSDYLMIMAYDEKAKGTYRGRWQSIPSLKTL